MAHVLIFAQQIVKQRVNSQNIANDRNNRKGYQMTPLTVALILQAHSVYIPMESVTQCAFVAAHVDGSYCYIVETPSSDLWDGRIYIAETDTIYEVM